ncbi:MAG TPA: GWxTD domain-containing protein [Verrucomicrobiae bacterium]|jgi:GWxTD domain-containing protein|nr:GWxTD domain-containing protein [Verrucomicrobiae bacterium]
MKLRLFRWMFASFSIVAVFCALAAAQDSPASNKSSGQPASQPASSSTPAGSAATTPTGSAAASTGTNAAGTAPAQAGDQSDPLKRSLTQEQKKKNSKALKQELSGTYKKWLKEDVVYIITPEEVSAFKALSNDEERDQFIENFWLRRDPTPDTPENEYKEEHYRRIAYANEHFGAGLPGWKTDRGRIYIIWGAPDQIESHPTGGTWDRPQEQGGGTTSTYPYEDWRYRYLEGIQENVELEFVDPCSCGDYHLTSDPNEKDALLHTPGGSTMYEQMGIGNRANRMDPYAPNTSPESGIESSKEFDKMEMMAKVQAPPPVKFKDLEEVVSHKISVNLMPFEVRTDFVKVTGDTVLVPVTLQIKNKDITFVSKDGIQRGTVNIFGRVTGITGKVAQTFEDTVQVDVPQELLEKTVEHSSLYWKAVPLRPGRYRIDLVVKDVNGDRVGTWSRGIAVPEYNEDKLASSSLILSDKMEKVATKSVGSGSFVLGETKLEYPHLDGADGKPASFKKDQRMALWMQVYNLQQDDKTKKPSANIEYEIVNLANNQSVVHSTESTDTMGNLGDQVTLEKTVSLSSLQPGLYRLTIKVDDNVSKQQIAPSVRFAVE